MYLVKVDKATYEAFDGQKLSTNWITFETLEGMLGDRYPWTVLTDEDIFMVATHSNNCLIQIQALRGTFREKVFEEMREYEEVGQLTIETLNQVVGEALYKEGLPTWLELWNSGTYSEEFGLPNTSFDVSSLVGTLKKDGGENFLKVLDKDRIDKESLKRLACLIDEHKLEKQ